MSPRRSSRTRPTQTVSSGLKDARSSASSSSSIRAERHGRSSQKASSPRKSTGHSSEDSANGHTGSSQSRRRRRGQESEDEGDGDMEIVKDDDVPLEDEEEEEEEEEEEITRCVCGLTEYPGLPGDKPQTPRPQQGIKQEIVAEGVKPAPVVDDPGLFIQCDTCKVWQHGGCVGILEESSSPEEYYCEECRKELHSLYTRSDGIRASRYLPVSESVVFTREGSPSKQSDKKTVTPLSGLAKRRLTINSSHTTYNEAEEIRRAIEQSKIETSKGLLGENGSRRAKRVREDSEESIKSDNKRQRTDNSDSASQASTVILGDDLSGDEGANKSSASSVKKRRNSVSRGQLDKEGREREKEKERPDVGKRKPRSERRRGDESDTETRSNPKDQMSNVDSGSVVSQHPATPPAVEAKPMRKTGRPARRGRLGRNQYTRDREGTDTADPPDASSPGTSNRDDNDESMGNTNGDQSHGGPGFKPSKARVVNPQRTTMTEMKKRVASILNFISKTQVELAESKTPPRIFPSEKKKKEAATAVVSTTTKAAAAVDDETTKLNGAPTTPPPETPKDATTADEEAKPEVSKPELSLLIHEEFSDLSSLEMMDALTRHLMLWQKEYGKYGER